MYILNLANSEIIFFGRLTISGPAEIAAHFTEKGNN